MVDSDISGSAICAVVLTILGIVAVHFGAYWLLERSGWYHPPHHDDDETHSSDIETSRECEMSSERAGQHLEDVHINTMGRV